MILYYLWMKEIYQIIQKLKAVSKTLVVAIIIIQIILKKCLGWWKNLGLNILETLFKKKVKRILRGIIRLYFSIV